MKDLGFMAGQSGKKVFDRMDRMNGMGGIISFGPFSLDPSSLGGARERRWDKVGIFFRWIGGGGRG
jgi:hypothetical protein